VRYYAKTLSNTHAKAGQRRNTEIKKNILSTIQNDLVQEFIDKAIVSFCNRFRCVLLQLVGTDIENSLFKYRVSYRHLTFMIETFELLMKSCKTFLFMHIQCATACSLEKVNFKV